MAAYSMKKKMEKKFSVMKAQQLKCRNSVQEYYSLGAVGTFDRMISQTVTVNRHCWIILTYFIKIQIFKKKKRKSDLRKSWHQR